MAITELKQAGAIAVKYMKGESPFFFVDLNWLKDHAFTDDDKFTYPALEKSREARTKPAPFTFTDLEGWIPEPDDFIVAYRQVYKQDNSGFIAWRKQGLELAMKWTKEEWGPFEPLVNLVEHPELIQGRDTSSTSAFEGEYRQSPYRPKPLNGTESAARWAELTGAREVEELDPLLEEPEPRQRYRGTAEESVYAGHDDDWSPNDD